MNTGMVKFDKATEIQMMADADEFSTPDEFVIYDDFEEVEEYAPEDISQLGLGIDIAT